MTGTTDVTRTIDTYLAMWNEEDRGRRAELIAQVWVTECRYVDPVVQAESHDALNRMVDGLYAQYPGHRFRRTSAVDAHHDHVRFGWELLAPDGAVVLGGIDVGRLAEDGRLRSLVVFFGDLAPAPAAWDG